MNGSPYKRPESVLVVVYTELGEVLLLQRREPVYFWQSVTGSLMWDEAAVHAAHRELAEETGLTAGKDLVDCRQVNEYPILPAWRSRYAPDVSVNKEHVFKLALTSRVKITLSSHEHQAFQWLKREDAARLASSPTDRAAIVRCV